MSADYYDDLYVEVLKGRMQMGMLWPNEKLFAISLINYHERFGCLTDKQNDAARRLAVRVVVERDKYYGF